MKTIKILFAALLAVCMTSCIKFKVEATVDVTVLKDGQPQKGVEVYRFESNMGEETTLYKGNAKDNKTTNDKGVAHFELRSPDDMDPSDLGLVASETFYFATYDAEGSRNSFASVTVAAGDKNKPVTLVIQENGGGEGEGLD